MDLIRRQDAIDAVADSIQHVFVEYRDVAVRMLEKVPSAEPDIVYCKDCRKHNQGINEAPYLADRCPLILHRGYAQGHEFDYQYCVYAERRTDE